MSLSDLVDAYIANGEALMTAGSQEEGLEIETQMREQFAEIQSRSQSPGFPTAEDGEAWNRFQDWELRHSVPDDGP